jgi:YjjG family noncanonical pyrimidine nucleotidase
VLKIKRFQLLFEVIDLQLDAAEYSQRYLENLSLGSDVIEGAEDVLSALHGRVGMVLITNGLTAVQRPRFSRSAVYHHFHDIIISEELGVAKPDRGIFDIAFSKMGNPRKQDVMIVGDSLTSDIKGGSDYGIDTCWFNPHARERHVDIEPSYEIHALPQLLQILDAGYRV